MPLLLLSQEMLKKAKSEHGDAVRQSLIEELCWKLNFSHECKMWNVEKARLVFDMMVEREVTSWNSMLSGYTQNGQAIEALLFF